MVGGEWGGVGWGGVERGGEGCYGVLWGVVGGWRGGRWCDVMWAWGAVISVRGCVWGGGGLWRGGRVRQDGVDEWVGVWVCAYVGDLDGGWVGGWVWEMADGVRGGVEWSGMEWCGVEGSEAERLFRVVGSVLGWAWWGDERSGWCDGERVGCRGVV